MAAISKRKVRSATDRISNRHAMHVQECGQTGLYRILYPSESPQCTFTSWQPKARNMRMGVGMWQCRNCSQKPKPRMTFSENLGMQSHDWVCQPWLPQVPVWALTVGGAWAVTRRVTGAGCWRPAGAPAWHQEPIVDQKNRSGMAFVLTKAVCQEQFGNRAFQGALIVNPR